MPRYHINVFDDEVALDPEGIDLPDIEAARVEAIAGARAIIAEHVTRGESFRLSHYLEITGEHGLVLDTIRFRDVVAVEA